MNRARYTGAHTAKTAEKAPAGRETGEEEKRRVKLPELSVLHRGRPASAPSEKTEDVPVPAQEKTELFPSVKPEKTERIVLSSTEKAARRLNTEPPQAVGAEFLPPRKRRKPSRRLIFLLAAVSAALLLGVVALLARRPIDEGAYEENMVKAAEAYEQADLDNALRYLRKAASYDETDECLKQMASCYERLGMYDKALELLRKVDATDAWADERIQLLEQQKALQKTADTVEVLGMLLPPDTTDLVLDGRGLTDDDLQEIVRLYALDSLSLIDNRITDFSPLAQLGSLDVLNLSGNRISDLSPLRDMTGLRVLYLDRNPIGDISPLCELQNLSSLSIQNCGVGEEQLARLASALPACAILSDAPEEDVSDISLGGLTFRSDVEELDLSGRGIRDISALAACKELSHLDLSNNEISDLQGLMNLPQLSSLDISANQISDLRPLMGIEPLRRLNAAGNALTDTAALSTMTGLQILNLSHNPIADFSGLRRLLNLTSLNLIDTGLRDDDLAYLFSLSRLTRLELEDNPALGNEAFGRLKSSLPVCTISHSELIYMIRIEELSVPSNVTQLDLSGQGISDLTGLERLNCLETLDLSRNQLKNLYVMQISASRGSLKELNLAFNQIDSLSDLTALTALERLNLYGNPLEDIHPLESMTGLTWLNVGSCGLSEELLQELRDALPECEIVLEV